MTEKANFRFKQFNIQQQFCAMKVGTDGVLLGAWAGVGSVALALDVGTGSGLIACMLAQRFLAAEVHGIDLDEAAAEQALYNAQQAPFGNRIQIWHASLAEWARLAEHSYDLIVCNPPYFSSGWDVEHPGRRKARVASFLPIRDLFSLSGKWLTENGRLAMILPASMLQEARSTAADYGLFIKRLEKVVTLKGKAATRILIEWQKEKTEMELTDICLYEDSRMTERYHALVAPFYLFA